MPWFVFVFLVFLVAMPWSILRLLGFWWRPGGLRRAASSPLKLFFKQQLGNQITGHQ
jgi:hypothetical protein